MADCVNFCEIRCIPPPRRRLEDYLASEKNGYPDATKIVNFLFEGGSSGFLGGVMYGLVNRALEELIIEKYGEEKWAETRKKAKVEVEAFISNEPYPDDVTYNLVGAAHDVLGVRVSDLMYAFGVRWMTKTAQENYGALLRAAGGSLREFLLNLPQFHAHVQLSYPKLQPPEFKCSDVGEDLLRLHYFSHRPGLVDFVTGLLEGLGEVYGTSVSVTLLEAKTKGADHDVFEIKWLSPAQRHNA